MARGRAKECGAKKRNGEPCKAAAMPNGRCRIHGGLTPSGFDLPQTTTGLYSKHLPSRLAATYEKQITNANLLDLKEQVSLIDSRTIELLSKLDTGESGRTWRLLRKYHSEALDAAIEHDEDGVMVNLREMKKLIDLGNHDADVWSEVYESVNLRKSLAETERRLLMQGEQMMTSEQVMLLVTAISSIVRANVQDREVLGKIVFGIDRLITAG